MVVEADVDYGEGDEDSSVNNGRVVAYKQTNPKHPDHLLALGLGQFFTSVTLVTHGLHREWVVILAGLGYFNRFFATQYFKYNLENLLKS